MACTCKVNDGTCKDCRRDLRELISDTAVIQFNIANAMEALQKACQDCKKRDLDAALAEAIRAKFGAPALFEKRKEVAKLISVAIVQTGLAMGILSWKETEAALRESGLPMDGFIGYPA